MSITKEHQYLGFKNAPLAWESNSFFSYSQADIEYLPALDFNNTSFNENLRLGKHVEQFCAENFKQHPNFELLLENQQVQSDKNQTLGELDYIVKNGDNVYHIELTSKFYLYKTDIPTEIHRWVGPNLRDSFIQKLEKLENKQFPLLYSNEAKQLLKNHNIDSNDVQQQVHFKAHLFIPLSLQKHTFPIINNDCIKGYYISYKEIDFLFPMALYHIPKKQDWFVNPKYNTHWESFVEVKPLILDQISRQHSPLVWIKRGDIYEQFFVTFW